MVEYNFYNPTRLVFGEGKIAELGKILEKRGYHKVLLIFGGGSIKKNGVYEQVVTALKDSNIALVECGGVRSNPILAKVREGIALAKAEQVDAVLAVGGGSVIDTAKSVAAGVYANDVWNIFERTEKITQVLPIFTVLTLSATASEMNCSAVLTNETEQKKYGTGHPLLYPQVSIIDPSIQVSLPWEQTVNGALDAMAHIMEYYFIGTEEETVLGVDEALLKSIIKAMGKLKLKPDDVLARANLAWAVTMALNGMSGTGLKGGDWACHDISHAISAKYPQIAHGAALGVLFPAWMEYVEAANEHQFNRFSRGIFDCIDIEEGVIKYRNLLKSWQAATKLRELGVQSADLATLSAMITERGPIGRLQKLSRSDVEEILRMAY